MAAGKFAKEMDALKEHLGKHQLKFTRQRELILTAFLRQEHITAEGAFRLSPDTDQQEFTLRFKTSKNPPHPLPPLSEDVI